MNSLHKVGDLVYYESHGLGIITKIEIPFSSGDAGLNEYFAQCPYHVEWVGNGGMVQYFKDEEIAEMKGYLKLHEQSQNR